MELRKGNYYEIFCNKIHVENQREFKIIEYLGNNTIRYLDTNKEVQLDETNTTFATKDMKGKKIEYDKNYFGFREISIMPIHLERLGFEKKEGNLYEYSNGLKIFYGLSTLGSNIKYIGSIVLKEEELNTIIEKIDVGEIEEKCSEKFDDIKKSVKEKFQKENCIYLPPEYMDTKIKCSIELHNKILEAMVKCMKPIKSINELFERLEDEGISIENKDEVAKL